MAVEAPAEVGGEAVDQVAGDEHHVVAALAQGRELDADDVEAEVEVLAEVVGLDLFAQVAVGRRDHAHVDGHGLGVADPLDLPLLEHAQQLDLEGQGHLADLVEEDGALVGGLELADLVGHGARERALDVAEELGLDQVLGDGPAVDRHEGALGPGRAVVDLVGDELLAGARLAGDQHGDVGAGDLVDPLVDLDHLGARADDRAELDVLEAVGQLGLLVAQLVEQGRVLEEERGLGGEHLQGLELGGGEQVDDVVVADVDEAQELAADQERHAHHARQLQVDDREAVLEARVVQGVRDDLRLLGGDRLADDVVGEQRLGVGDVLAGEVAGHANLVAVGVDLALGLSLARRRGAGAREHQKALARPGQADDLVDQLVEQAVEVGGLGQQAREVLQPAHRDQADLVGLLLRGLAALGLVEGREGQLEAADDEDLAVAQVEAAVLLAVDEKGVRARGRLEPVAAGLVGQGRVHGGDVGADDADVAVARRADGGQPADQGVADRFATGGVSEVGHEVWPVPVGGAV
ncbi:hypothetical protein PPSIR1_10590 [Plesiocystis pacifica SIR-1]|uniref:Uncharacterized protein n=1 Tax=Plesiocystis pacifica SIR-1 TaxID=391625 RepID=A6G4V2_9BACT|nr:hypothetical protein PPSIR1_10590 [Plesiocystis pacifica SIR-1]